VPHVKSIKLGYIYSPHPKSFQVLLQSLLLFLAASVGGVAVLIIRKPSPAFFNLLLMFSGGYLFSITFLHLLPELFMLHANAKMLGLYILIGFFLQLFLELCSKGAEHGHMHEVHQEEQQHLISPLTLMVALCIHAFLDGVILSSPTSHLHHGHDHGTNGLLIGVLLHKVPEAFALASILRKIISRQQMVIVCLFIFAIASPLGLWISNYYSQQQLLSKQGSLALWGIVSGSFVHITTTIFFEANPGHHLNIRKFMVSLAGAGLAFVCEFLL
jgi:zinc transporter ZupT